MRISAQLIDAVDGCHAWSECYDRHLTEIFEVQDEIAQSIALALKLTLTRPAVLAPPTKDLVAYELWTRGRSTSQTYTAGAYARSRRCYEAAIARDPRFARAHFALAELLFYVVEFGLSTSPADGPKAREALTRALECDELLSHPPRPPLPGAARQDASRVTRPPVPRILPAAHEIDGTTHVPLRLKRRAATYPRRELIAGECRLAESRENEDPLTRESAGVVSGPLLRFASRVDPRFMTLTVSAAFILAVPVVAFTATAARQPSPIEVCGRLVGADGRPMIHATVVVSRPVLPGSGFIKEEERLLGTQELAATDAFCVKVSGANLLQVQAFGVNHEAADALLWAEPGSKHEVSIKLATPALVTDLSAAKVTCYQSVPNFRSLGDAALVRQPDGRYLAVIKGADVPASCGLWGVTRETCVGVEPRGPDCLQGTQADRYELQRASGIGRYAAIVTPVHGEGRLVLDLSALPRPDGPPAVTFPAAAATARRLTAIWQTMLARDLRDRSGASPAPSRTEITAALAAARAEPEPVVRQMLWANYLSLATAHMRAPAPEHAADREGVAEALRTLTPSSAFWPLVRTHLFDAVRTAGLSSTPDGYAGDVVRNLRIPSERPGTINAFADAARREHDTVTQNGWLGWLLRDYAGHPVARAARERYGLNDKVQVGKPFPEFAVRSLDDPGVTLTVKTIGARFLLVDFWATWCGPCIAEIPGLQKAYARFSGQGFRILSYSLDADADLVRQFRRNRLPMPWLHGIFPQGPDGLTTEFGLFGIPAPVLLDAEGRVVAMRDDLLGGKLEALLASLFQPKARMKP